MNDPTILALARELLAAREGKDRATLRRLKREGDRARAAATVAEHRALAMERDPRADAAQKHAITAYAASLLVLRTALDIADTPELFAKLEGAS